MPRYDYQCLDCSFEFEAFNSISERNNQRCVKPSCGGAVKILISKPAVALFTEGWYEDITDRPLYIRTPQELREACDKHGAYSRYLRDTTYFKTSPGESLEERTERERRTGAQDSSETYITSTGDGDGALL